jgi:DsbC/DsbD-like thiol-disulfide interchange protein
MIMITRRRALKTIAGAAGIGLSVAAGRPILVRAEGELAAASPWSAGLGAKMRLVRGAPLGAKDAYGAAIEIALDSGYKTYWRMPGDTGIPPLFDWSGSRNLASIAPAWPVPRRFEEGGVSAIGYDGGSVVLPLRLAATDPTQAVELRLSLLYAACRTICVPEKADAGLSLIQDGPGGLYTALIEAAAREVPKRIDAGELGLDGQETVRLAFAEGNRGMTLKFTLDEHERVLDVFVEGPDRWLFGAPRPTASGIAGEIDLPLLDHPKWVDRAADIPFTLTVLTDLRAIETMIATRPAG